MNEQIDAGIASKIGKFSDAVAVTAGSRTVFVSGNVGINADGVVPDDFSEQAENTWANLLKILATAGMGITDIVKMTTFLTRRQDLLAYREIRERILGGHLPASTLVFAPELVGANWLIEIEVVAAK